MNDKTQVVGTTTQINYQFTAIPTNLFFSLDGNCRSMLATLTQLSTYYADENGWFFRTYEDLQYQSRMSQNLVKATLQTLFNHNIIEVKGVGKSKGKHPNYYKINFNEFSKYESLKLEDIIKNPTFQIETVNYKGSCFKVNFTRDETVKSDNKVNNTVVETVNNTVKKTVKSDNNINNIDNIKNINDINNNNIYNNINDINNNILDNSTFDKVEDNNTFENSNFLNDNKNSTTKELEVIERDDDNNTNIDTNTFQIEVKEENTHNGTNVLQVEKDNNNTSSTTLSKQDVITKYYHKVDDYNNRMYNATNIETYEYLTEQMTKLLQKCLDNSKLFSNKQWDLLIQKMNHFEKLQQTKYNYFNGGKKTPTAEEQHNEMMQQYYAMF